MIDRPSRSLIVSPITVGREPELAALDLLRAEALVSRGQTALIIGEAGVGKSRLVAECLARETHITLLRSACFEADHGLPYASLLELLRVQLGPLPPAEAASALGPLAPHLIGLLPEYATLLPQLRPSLDPQHERQRISQAFLQFFAESARAAPLLVVIEDLHWADEASLAVLLALTRRVHTLPLLLLLTCRDEQHAGTLSDFRAAIGRERLATLLPLGRLSYEHVDAMLRAIFVQPRPIRGDFLTALYQLTEGNPFFVEEVLTALVAEREIFVVDGRWERRALVELHIPDSIQAAVQRRSAALSAEARQLARLAAVAGRQFDFDLLMQLTGQTEATLVALIKELISAQLVLEDAPDRFAFRHALTGAALAAELLARERRSMHSQIATALETLTQAQSAELREARAVELAHHFFAAHEWRPALRYARQAAERAWRLYAPAAAADQLACALAAARELGLAPPVDLLRLRGNVHETLGAAEAALTDYLAALAQARADGDQREEWRTLLTIGFWYAARDSGAMGTYLRLALELARTLGDPAMLGESLNRYGNWHLFLEQPGEALRYHHESLAIFQTIGDQTGLATTYDLLGVTQIMSTDKPAAVEYYRQAIALFRQLGDQTGLVSALATVALRGISYYHTTTVPIEDGYGAWVADGEQALQLARQIGWRSGEANALVYLALIHGASGDYGLAIERAQAAHDLASEIQHPVWLVGAALARGAILLDLLDYRAARAVLKAALPLATTIGPFFARRVAGYLALVAIAQRDHAGASEALAPLLDSATPMETQGQRIDWLAHGELSLAQGSLQLALDIAERLIASAPHADQRGAGCVPALWQLRGEALAGLGQHDAAAAALTSAAAGAERLGLLPTRWRALRSLGRLEQVTGRRHIARTAYAEARAIIEQLAQRIPDPALSAQFLRAARAQLPRGTVTPGASTHSPAEQLTRREREVAVLVAQGNTSREIAEALVLGQRTVETHISNVLGKLGLGSRREIAAWAIEVGLVRPVA